MKHTPVILLLAQGNQVPVGAVYRKYSAAKGWYDYLVDVHNAVPLALADSDGNCPALLSNIYKAGLQAG